MQEAARARCIDDQSRVETDWLALPMPFEPHHVSIVGKLIQVNFVDVINSERLRLTNQKMIEAGAIPVRIRDRIMRARRDQQLILPVQIWPRGLSQYMMMKGKPSLQPAS